MSGKNVYVIVLVLLVAGVAFSGCLGEGDYEDTNLITASPSPSPVSKSSIIETSSPGGYVFGLEDVDPLVIGEDVGSWLDQQKAKGIGLIAFEPFDLDGYMIFDSPALRKAGFQPDPDYGTELLPQILKEAGKRDIQVVLMIEGIAHIIDDMFPYSDDIKKDRLTPEAVEGIIKDISTVAGEAGTSVYISEEAFEAPYVDAISRAAQANGVGYMHFFEDLGCRADVYVSEDYAYYPKDARTDPRDQDYLRSLQRMGTYYGELGMLNTMYGGAHGCGAESQTLTAGGWGMGAKTHQNIALMRGVQFGPTTYYFVVAEGDNGPVYSDETKYVEEYNFNEKLLPLLNEYGRKDSDSPKPVANIVIDLPEEGEDIVDLFTNSYLSSMAAVSNAMLAAGYDLVVTKHPVPDAGLYYVFTPGKIFDEEQDLPDDITSLANGDTPVFYQVAGELPTTSNWEIVRQRLELGGDLPALLNDDAGSSYDPIPEAASYKFPEGIFDVAYGGYSFEFEDPEGAGRFSLGHYIHLIDPETYSGDVLLTGVTSKDGDGLRDDPTALIIRKGNRYFVNGGYLHLYVSSVLANIMAGLRGNRPVYNKPSYGYFTNGEDRAVFYAPYDVEIDLNLPDGSKVAEFDEAGNRIETSISLTDGRLTGRVERFHLIIIT